MSGGLLLKRSERRDDHDVDDDGNATTVMDSPSAAPRRALNRSRQPTVTMTTSTLRAPPTPPRTDAMRTPSTERPKYGLSHDSDVWREVLSQPGQRRHRTAPPKGLDRESGVFFSNARSYGLINQSFMVGEATPRSTSQRSGMAVSCHFCCCWLIACCCCCCFCVFFFSLCAGEEEEEEKETNLFFFSFFLLYFFIIFSQSSRKVRKTPMSDPVARYASHKQAWSRNIFLTSGSSKRPYSFRGVTGGGDESAGVDGSVSMSPFTHKPPTILKKKKAGYVVPTNKRRDNVRGDIRTKMKMVRMMAAQAGKRGGVRGASRAKQPSTFKIPSSKKRQALRWQIRSKMLSPA